MSAICANCIFYRNKDNREFCLYDKNNKAFDSNNCKDHMYEVEAVCLCETCKIKDKYIDGCRATIKDYSAIKGIGAVKCKKYVED